MSQSLPDFVVRRGVVSASQPEQTASPTARQQLPEKAHAPSLAAAPGHKKRVAFQLDWTESLSQSYADYFGGLDQAPRVELLVEDHQMKEKARLLRATSRKEIKAEAAAAPATPAKAKAASAASAASTSGEKPAPSSAGAKSAPASSLSASTTAALTSASAAKAAAAAAFGPSTALNYMKPSMRAYVLRDNDYDWVSLAAALSHYPSV